MKNIRNLTKDKQSQVAWKTINEVSTKKSTLRTKLEVDSQEERIQKLKEHYKNLQGNPTKVTDKAI